MKKNLTKNPWAYENMMPDPKRGHNVERPGADSAPRAAPQYLRMRLVVRPPIQSVAFFRLAEEGRDKTNLVRY